MRGFCVVAEGQGLDLGKEDCIFRYFLCCEGGVREGEERDEGGVEEGEELHDVVYRCLRDCNLRVKLRGY